MFHTFGRSWQLIKICWGILRSDKDLIVFPLVSFIGLVVVTLVFGLPLLGSGILEAISESSGSDSSRAAASAVVLFIGFLFLFAQALVVNFSNAALTGAVFMRFDGKDPTVGDGFRIASSRIGAIVPFALINALLSMLSNAIRSAGRNGEGNFIGRLIAELVASLIDAAWDVVTFLAIPVIVAENLGAIDAIKRSAQLLKDTWGRQIAGTVTIGAIMGLISLGLLLVIGVPGFLIATSLGSGFLLTVVIVLMLAVVGAVTMVGGALNSIYRAALYRYAHDHKVEFFGEEVLQGAFKPKGAEA